MKRILLFSFLMFLVSYQIQAASLQEAWALFKDNELSDAKYAFEKCNQDASMKEEACLGLTLICQMTNKDEEAFKYFKEFFLNSVNPYPYAYAMYHTSSFAFSDGKLKKERLQFIEEILKREQLDGTFKTNLYQSLVNHYISINKLDKAREYGKYIGSVDKWQMLGEFENISASGYNKSFGALEHPESNYRVKNKAGAEVTWFAVNNLRNDYWLDFEYHFITNNSIVYAQTFVYSPIDQAIELRLGTSGSYKMWLNDKIISETDEERNNDLDTYNGRGKLKAGYNRVLIQIGESIAGASNLMLRITDQQGIPIKGLLYKNEYQAYNKDNSKEISPVIRHFAEGYFEDKLKSNANDFVSHVMLAFAYLHNQKTFEARKIVKELEASNPNSLLVLSIMNQAYTQDKNYSGQSAVLKKMKEVDSLSLYALQLEYNEQIEKENLELAESISNKMELMYGVNEETWIRKINLASKNKQVEKLQDLILTAFKLYPDNLNFMSLKYEVEKELKKNIPQAIATLAEYSKNNANDNVNQTLIGEYFQTGNVNKGVAILEKMIENKPYATGFRSKLADIYFELGQYEKALNLTKETIQFAPSVSGLYAIIGKIYKEQGKTDQAIEYYEKCLYYNPLDYGAREQLNKLQKQAPIFSNFEEPKYDELAKISVSQKDFPDDHSYILCNDAQTVVYKGGISEEKHFVMVKTLNAAGVDYWKEYDIDFAGNEELKIEDAYIIKKNGTKVDAETKDKLVVYRNLEAGDNICLTYKIFHYSSGKLAEHFWDKMIFTRFLPARSIKYSLMIDNNTKFNWKLSNSEMNPIIREKGKYTQYIWERKDQKGTKGEKLMPSVVDFGEVLHISTFPDWDYIAKWYTDIAITKTKPDFEVKETVASLFKDKTNLSDAQKVKEIYNYIVKNVRYSSISFRQSGLIPQRPADVLNTKIGDCKDVSSLFVAMCKEVGIESNLVLVATRNFGDNQMPLPSIDFNHCIAKVNINGLPYFVELTTDNYPFSAYNINLLKAPALEIVSTKSDLFQINPTIRTQNNRMRNSSILFVDNRMMITRKNIKTGVEAGGMRDVYRDAGIEQRNKILKESLAGEYSSIKLESFTFDENLMNTEDTLKYEFVYSVPLSAVFEEIAGLNIMKLNWSDGFEVLDFFNEEERKFGMELFNLIPQDYSSETITLKLLQGKTLVQTPKDLVLSTDFADYSMKFELKGDVLKAVRNMKLKQDIIPASKFQEAKKFFQAIIKSDKTQLAFK